VSWERESVVDCLFFYTTLGKWRSALTVLTALPARVWRGYLPSIEESGGGGRCRDRGALFIWLGEPHRSFNTTRSFRTATTPSGVFVQLQHQNRASYRVIHTWQTTKLCRLSATCNRIHNLVRTGACWGGTCPDLAYSSITNRAS
jgi:hypothetical protein